MEEFHFGIPQLTSLKTVIVANGDIDGNSKCLTSCVVKKANLVQNGKVNEVEVKAIDATVVSVDFGACASVTGSDECDTNFQLVKCVVQQYFKVNPNMRT